tara:strand:- start:9596 stop:9976 length:381 start_codon:yes stop_codon:yes gene_type:complete
MKLYKILAVNCQDFFGGPNKEDRISRPDVYMIAQTPSCDAFLFLSKDEQEIIPGLELCQSVPIGFDMTYCQEWGLTMNDNIVDLIIKDLRKKGYGAWEDQLATIYNKGVDGWKEKVLAIKQQFPKR